MYSNESTSTEDLYDAAVKRRQVLFTRVQSCHEKSGHARLHCAYTRVGVLLACASEDLKLARI